MKASIVNRESRNEAKASEQRHSENASDSEVLWGGGGVLGDLLVGSHASTQLHWNVNVMIFFLNDWWGLPVQFRCGVIFCFVIHIGLSTLYILFFLPVDHIMTCI